MALEKTTECSERGKREKNGANTSMTRIIIDLSQCAAALDLSYAKCGQISSIQALHLTAPPHNLVCRRDFSFLLEILASVHSYSNGPHVDVSNKFWDLCQLQGVCY